jgi:hypothetical protein
MASRRKKPEAKLYTFWVSDFRRRWVFRFTSPYGPRCSFIANTKPRLQVNSRTEQRKRVICRCIVIINVYIETFFKQNLQACISTRSTFLVGFEVLATVVMKNSVFWDITPCSQLKVKAASNSLSRWFLARLIPRPWRWRRHVPPKRRLTFNGLHFVISQKIELFYIYLSCSSFFCDEPILRNLIMLNRASCKVQIVIDRYAPKINSYDQF